MPTPCRVGTSDHKAIHHSNHMDNMIDLVGFTDSAEYSSFENLLKGCL